MMKIFTLCFFLLLGLSVAWAADSTRKDMSFAGVWFYRTLNKEAVAKQFPVGQYYGCKRNADEASHENQDARYNLAGKIYSHLQQEKKPTGNRLVDHLGDGDEAMISSQEDALVLACALNYEHVEVQRLPLGKKTISKILAEIGFDVVLCNFRDRRIVGILPLRAQVVDAMQGVPDEEHKQELLRRLYETQVVEMFVNATKKPYNNETAPKTIGIGEITFFDKAMKLVPENLRDSIKTYYSSYICAAFYHEVGVPILPYSGGNELLYYSMREKVDDVAHLAVQTAEDDATARTMTADGIKSFVLKKPDYTVDVIIPGYETQVLAKNKYQRHLAFVAGTRLTLKEGEKTIYTSKFIDSVQALYTHDAELGVPWIYYQAATYKMFKNAAQKLRKQKETKSIIFTCSNK